MKRIHGILGAAIVIFLAVDLLLFFFKDNSYKDNPSAIFTEFIESVGGE